jgi:hypothetical protein
MTRNDTDLGSPDHDTALRAILSASVSDVRMPADLLDRAMSRNRKRTMRNGLMGAVAAAGVLATVIATAVSWTPGHPASARPVASPHLQRPAQQHPQMLTAAYVVDHVATTLMNSYRMISVDRGSGGMDNGSINYTDMATQQQHYVSGLRDSSGQPYLQTTTSVRDGIWTEFDVDYADHVYSTLTASDIDHGQRVTVSSWLPLQSNADPAAAFRQALKAHAITVAGHQVLDGRDTILLRVTDSSARSSALESQDPPSWIWVDASTYMVVQTEHFIHAYKGGTFIPPTPKSQLIWIPLVNRVTWLTPTPQNLALLTLSPPAGFTSVPYSEMTSYLGRIS